MPKLLETIDYLANATGFHEFAEFTAEDVGTVNSGLNSIVLASNNEMVILPMSKYFLCGASCQFLLILLLRVFVSLKRTRNLKLASYLLCWHSISCPEGQKLFATDF